MVIVAPESKNLFDHALGLGRHEARISAQGELPMPLKAGLGFRKNGVFSLGRTAGPFSGQGAP